MSSVLKNGKKYGNLVFIDDLEARIERARRELHSMVSLYDSKGIDDKILEQSQYLDKLIVSYIKRYRS